MPTVSTVKPTLSSPNVGNLGVKRGYMSAQFEGENAFSDMGYVLSAEITMSPTLLHYYSSRDGIQKKVLSVVTRLDASGTVICNEQTARNMGLAVMALASGSESPGGTRLELMSHPRFYASLEFTDTSTYGAEWNWYIPLALLTPKQAIALIAQGSGDWAQIPLTFDVQYDQVSESFGYVESTMEHT